MNISFVIPAYNEENYLGKCLESVLKTTEKIKDKREVIVVNNASTDKTEQLARSFPGVKVVNEPQKGLARARQAGFAAATGDLVANIDADTIMPDNWIDEVVRSFEADPELVALSGPPLYFDLSKEGRFWVWVFVRLTFVAYILNRFVFRRASVVQGGNFVVRRTALEKIGGFDPRFSFYGEDADIARRLFKVGKVKYTFKLPILMSGRRLMAEGQLTIGIRYTINYIWVALWGKPFTKTSVDIRAVEKK